MIGEIVSFIAANNGSVELSVLHKHFQDKSIDFYKKARDQGFNVEINRVNGKTMVELETHKHDAVFDNSISKCYISGQENNARKLKEIIFSVEEIGVSEATDLLGNKYAEQRLINKKTVDKYCRDMISGNWMVSPQPLIVSPDGELLDGQHRLSAIIKSGIPMTMIVARNCPVDIYTVLDSGRVRSKADAVQITKDESSYLSRIFEFVYRGVIIPSNSEMQALLESGLYVNHKKLLEASKSKKAVISSSTTRSVAGMLMMEALLNNNNEAYNYVINQYRVMCENAFNEYNSVAGVYAVRLMQGAGDPILPDEQEAMAFVLFDESYKDRKKLKLKPNLLNDRKNKLRACIKDYISRYIDL